MKRIDTRLEQLEQKAAVKKKENQDYCNCPMEIIINAPITLDELNQSENEKYKPRTTGTCPRCGGKYSKDHPALPRAIIQPVKATTQGDE